MTAAPLLLLLLALQAAQTPQGQKPPAAPAAEPAQAPTVSPSEELQRGRLAHARGEWSKAVEILQPLIYPEIRLESEQEITQAHHMLGVAYFYEKREAEAAREFRKLLQLRPDFRMSPLIDPQDVVAFFGKVLKEQETALVELERKRKEVEAQERKRMEALRNGPTVIEKRYVRNSYALNFVPFGVGQFQNGHRKKGWFFFSTQTLFGTVSLAALTMNFALYGFNPRVTCKESDATAAGSTAKSVRGCPPGQVPDGREVQSQQLTTIQVASGGLFFAMAIWGIIDAVVHHQPEVPLVLRPPPVRKLRLELLPVGAGGTPGGSLAFRF